MDNSIILLRVSSKKDQEELLQLPECEAFNKEKGWNCINIFRKEESAFKNEEGVWKDEVEWAKQNNVQHIIVWNMDRYSRLDEVRVLEEVKVLSTIHKIKVHAVHGDSWSKVIEAIGSVNELGFIGKALVEFLDTVLRGLEHQRAHRESVVKSERVRLATRKTLGKPTVSYKGNKWGRKEISTQAKNKILELAKNGSSLRTIAAQVQYADKNNKMKNVSFSTVRKVLAEFKKNQPIENIDSTTAINGLINAQEPEVRIGKSTLAMKVAEYTQEVSNGN